MSSPLISVIMPAYNGSGTIAESLESVFAQTLKDYELIVVDDASTDDTVKVVERYGSSVKLIRRTTNSGICEVARSQGIASSRGRYCAFIDQDDLWAPEKLEHQVGFMERHPEFPLSHHYVNVIDAAGAVQEIRHDGRIPPSGPCARQLLEHCFVTISSIMVRGKLWMEAGNPASASSPNTDFEYFLNLLRRFPTGFGFIPEVLGSYRRAAQGMSRNRWKWSPEDVDALERVWRQGSWKGLVPRGDVQRILINSCWNNAEYHRHRGWPGRSLYFIRRGMRYAPWYPRYWVAGLKAIVQGIASRHFDVT